MNMPSPCELCEEIVEYDQLKVCSDCKRFVCRDCFSMGLCNACIEGIPEGTPTYSRAELEAAGQEVMF